MDLKNENIQDHVLSNICGDLFSLASYLRESKDPDLSDKLFNGILDLFNAMEKKAKDAGIMEGDISKAKHAIVALIDEGQQWASRLERRYFNSSTAGEDFFDRLDEMLKEIRSVAKDSKPSYNVLEVYYICLTLGFSGRHIWEPEKLQEYIGKLREALNIIDAGELAPNGKRPQEEIKKQRNTIPLWLVYAIMGGNILLILIAFIFLKSGIIHWASGLANQIRSFLN